MTPKVTRFRVRVIGEMHNTYQDVFLNNHVHEWASNEAYSGSLSKMLDHIRNKPWHEDPYITRRYKPNLNERSN